MGAAKTRIGLLAAMLLTLVACSGKTTPDAAQTATQGAGQPVAPEPNPDGTPDPAVVQKLIDAGVEQDEARLLALTTWNASNPEPGVAHVVLTYPWGDTSRIELRVVRVDAGDVQAAEILEASVEPGRVALAIRYYVPEADIPMTHASALPPALRTRELDLIGLLIPAAHAQQFSGGYGQVFQRWLTETASDEVRDKLLEKMLGTKAGGRVGAAINVANAGKELHELSEKARKRLRDLDELRKCIESNPSGAQWVAGQKEKILKQLDAARAEIIADDTVRGVNTVTGVVAGALTPIVGFLTGPALAQSQDELEQLVKQRMNEIRRSAPECDKNSYVIDGVGDCRGPWKVCDVTKPFTFAACGGSMTHTPSSARSGSFNFNHSGVRGDGTYTLTGDKNRMSATYQGTVCLPTGACIQQPPGKAVWTQIDDCDG